VKINEISSSLSPFSPLVCYVYRVHGTAAWSAHDLLIPCGIIS
jgi:hypothetical protein